MSSENEPPKLGTKSGDIIAMVGKSTIGLIPGVGPAFGELINQFIPNQRADRIEQYLEFLDAKLADLAEGERRQRLLYEEAAYLVEEGGHQSARATSDERRGRLSSIVAHGISGDEKDRIEAKRLLWLMQQIDDDQIIQLAGRSSKYQRDEQFVQSHLGLLAPPNRVIGAPQDEVDRAAMRELANGQLVSLGLLQAHYRVNPTTKLPNFDSAGNMSLSYTTLTSLGCLLLRRIGLLDEGEF